LSERILISSVQKELADERRAIRDFLRGDPLLRRFFDAFLFEDLPASDRRSDEVYLAEVERATIYIGLFGSDYGSEDGEGLSPTEREFDQATALGKTRLILVKGADDAGRHKKMRALIRKAGAQLVRRRFTTLPELTTTLFASLVDYLESRGVIQDRAFEDRPCLDATTEDLDSDAVLGFVRRARHERQFPLPETTPLAAILTHLSLLQGDRPSNAALLLFGREPQRFIPCAEVRCMHFHGTEIVRPAPFYRIFKGNLFEQVDHAENFVLSVINRSVGTRAESVQAPVIYEIPPAVVREAIVNAVAHRDYASSAAVQVSVFADRVEVWNPGELLPPLTPERLRVPHRSIARNPRVCEALFLARYIEKFGTGTLMMIRESTAHALPEPDFEQRASEFVASVWRDWLTDDVLRRLGLNERQRQALAKLRERGRISNQEYQDLLGVAKRTAHRDLADLLEKGVVVRIGTTGKGTYYVLGKGARNGPKGSVSPDDPEGATKGPKGP
jgi:predicted HTH transcriptional regulator